MHTLFLNEQACQQLIHLSCSTTFCDISFGLCLKMYEGQAGPCAWVFYSYGGVHRPGQYYLGDDK